MFTKLITGFSGDGHRLASAGDDGTLRLWMPVQAVPLVDHRFIAQTGQNLDP